MRPANSSPLAAVAAALALGTAPLAAQVRVGIGAGAVASSPLVRDSILTALTLAPRPAASITFWLETRLNQQYRVSAGLQTAWSQLAMTENGTTTKVVPLASWTPTVALDRHLLPGLSAYASAGAVLYRADRTRSNLFRRGASPLPVFGLGFRYDHPLGGGLQLTGRLGYDFHRFSTPSMRDEGFRGERAIHRVGLSVGLSRTL